MKKDELLAMIEKVKKGDEVAYEALYRWYYPQVYRFALYISHCDADAHDIAQATMIAVHDKLNTLQKPEFFHSWVKRITINQSTKIFRKGKHVIYNDGVVDSLSNMEDYCMDVNPMKTIHFQNDREVMIYFFGMLPEGQREVMELMYFEQYTMKEIADALKVPEGTVKSRIHTAKAFLKKKILSYEKDEDIALDFKSDALLSTLGGSTIASILTQPIMKMKSLLSTNILNGSLIALTTVVVGVTAAVSYDYVTEHFVEKDSSPKLSEKLMQKKAFTTSMIEEQEINTAQDAYFKIITWANNDNDIKAASSQELEEIERLLLALQAYGGSYYTLLETQGWVENFYKFKK